MVAASGEFVGAESPSCLEVQCTLAKGHRWGLIVDGMSRLNNETLISAEGLRVSATVDRMLGQVFRGLSCTMGMQ